MSDDELNTIREAVQREYNAPPETPTEEIWARIAVRIQDAENPSVADVVELPVSVRKRWLGLPPSFVGAVAAAVAALVVGIGIGRMSPIPVPPGGPSNLGVPPIGDAGEESRGAYAFATFQHLQQTGSLLNTVRTSALDGRVDDQVRGWGSELLTETRILLDSPSASDPQFQELLKDLELILIQVVRLEQGREDELHFVVQGIEERDVLLRLQAAIPEDYTAAVGL